MKYKGDLNKLKDLGYSESVFGDYYFKVRSQEINRSVRKRIIYTAIFIDTKSKEVSFEGTDRFKNELLNELITLM